MIRQSWHTKPTVFPKIKRSIYRPFIFWYPHFSLYPTTYTSSALSISTPSEMIVPFALIMASLNLASLPITAPLWWQSLQWLRPWPGAPVERIEVYCHRRRNIHQRPAKSFGNFHWWSLRRNCCENKFSSDDCGCPERFSGLMRPMLASERLPTVPTSFQ